MKAKRIRGEEANAASGVPAWVPGSLRQVYRTAAEVMGSAELDAAHRFDHVERVTQTALTLAREEGADELTVCAAGLLHDLGRVKPGDHAKRSVELAAPLLAETPLTDTQVGTALAAIADHRYADGKIPQSLEGQVLQDADRLDALGALGVARTFAKGSSRQLYCPTDPFGEARPTLDDRTYTVDHFYRKLLKLKDTFHTSAARRLAEKRHAFLVVFLEQLRGELAL